MAASSGSPEVSSLHSLLDSARRHRLDGDFYAYYRTLTRVAEALASSAPGDPSQTDRVSALRSRAQDVGYRNARPSYDELDGDLRELERALARHDEGASARDKEHSES